MRFRRKPKLKVGGIVSGPKEFDLRAYATAECREENVRLRKENVQLRKAIYVLGHARSCYANLGQSRQCDCPARVLQDI